MAELLAAHGRLSAEGGAALGGGSPKEIEDAQKAERAKLDAERAEMERRNRLVAEEQQKIARAQEAERQRLSDLRDEGLQMNFDKKRKGFVYNGFLKSGQLNLPIEESQRALP
jgi:hypothetical protein